MCWRTQRPVLAAVVLLAPALGAGRQANAQPAAESPAPTPPRPADAFNHVEGESTVVKLKPAGTVVKKGDWVVEFDSSDLKDALDVQKVGIQAAEAAYRGARMAREVAEIGVKEFVEGISKEDIENADAEIARATAERVRAEDQAKKSKADADLRALGEAQIAEQKAKDTKAILVKYVEVANVKELEAEVQKAREAELKAEGDWQREKSKGEKIRRQIAACQIVAPIDGTVGYLRPVEVEDTFRQGEVVFRVFPNKRPTPAAPPE